MLPNTVAELKPLGISPKEFALDGGFNIGPTTEVSKTPTGSSVHL
jgi:hypothetical protein